jgi:hypothetical protein
MLEGAAVLAGGAAWAGFVGCAAGGVEGAELGWRISKGAAADGACCAGPSCGAGRAAGGVLGAPGDMPKDACATAFCAVSVWKASKEKIRTRRTIYLYLTAGATDGAGGFEVPIFCRPKK